MNKIKIYIAATVITVLAMSAFFLFVNSANKDTALLSAEADVLISEILTEAGIDPESTTVNKTKTSLIEKEFTVPQNKNLDQIKTAITDDERLKKFSLSKIESSRDEKGRLLVFEFNLKKATIYRLLLRKKAIPAKLAIVLDDWGYSNKFTKEFLKIDAAITCSILPSQNFSEKLANIFNQEGYEVMLHLPMEPYNAKNTSIEPSTILTSMSEQEIIDIVKQNIAAIPHVKGVNNHMGSKATEDTKIMQIVLTQIKQYNLFFLDSYVTAKSEGFTLAQELNIPSLKRDIFIDNTDDIADIQKQLNKAKNIAKDTGSAIAIGHAKPATIAALQNSIKRFKNDGIEFVFVSELIK